MLRRWTRNHRSPVRNWTPGSRRNRVQNNLQIAVILATWEHRQTWVPARMRIPARRRPTAGRCTQIPPSGDAGLARKAAPLSASVTRSVLSAVSELCPVQRPASMIHSLSRPRAIVFREIAGTAVPSCACEGISAPFNRRRLRSIERWSSTAVFTYRSMSDRSSRPTRGRGAPSRTWRRGASTMSPSGSCLCRHRNGNRRPGRVRHP